MTQHTKVSIFGGVLGFAIGAITGYNCLTWQWWALMTITVFGGLFAFEKN